MSPGMSDDQGRSGPVVLNMSFVTHDPNVWSGRALQEAFVDPADNGLASMYPASDWSVWCSGPSWISARMRSHYRTGLERAIRVTSVRMRREDRSSIVVSSSRRPRRVRDVGYVIDSSSLRAVPLFVPGGRSFVPACARRRAARKGRQGRPSCCPDVLLLRCQAAP